VLPSDETLVSSTEVGIEVGDQDVDLDRLKAVNEAFTIGGIRGLDLCPSSARVSERLQL